METLTESKHFEVLCILIKDQAVYNYNANNIFYILFFDCIPPKNSQIIRYEYSYVTICWYRKRSNFLQRISKKEMVSDRLRFYNSCLAT